MIGIAKLMTWRRLLGMAVNMRKNTVQVAIDQRVARIELDYPNVFHRLKKDMVKDIIQKLKEISQSDDVEIVVLTGKEGTFSADLNSGILNDSKNESDFYYIMDLINELIMTLYSMPKLTISGINGKASGLGVSLALATDHVLVSNSSEFALNTLSTGLIPVGGAHFFLERRLGEDRAKHLIWEAKTWTAKEALQNHLINEIAQGELNQAIEEKVNQWLDSPIQAMIKTKKILGEKNRPHSLKMLELEKFAQYRMLQTEENQDC